MQRHIQPVFTISGMQIFFFFGRSRSAGKKTTKEQLLYCYHYNMHLAITPPTQEKKTSSLKFCVNRATMSLPCGQMCGAHNKLKCRQEIFILFRLHDPVPSLVVIISSLTKKIKVNCFSPPGVLLSPEFRPDSLRTESMTSSPSPVFPSTQMTAVHSKTGSRDSCTQTDKNQSQDTSKPGTPALQSMMMPNRLSSTSPLYITERGTGKTTN